MRNLTAQEIEALLQKYQGARRIAIENFLMTCANNMYAFEANNNLKRDTILYSWNKQTVLAIREGIQLAQKSGV